MSIVTTITSPSEEALRIYGSVLESISPAVLPAAHASMRQIKISVDEGLLTAILGCDKSVNVAGHNVLAGAAIRDETLGPWWRFGQAGPDGSYVLFRANRSGLELLTDFAGSRPIWYVRLNCGGLAASTCFEVLIALLGDFESDDCTLGWFLSSGTCGPGRSWDMRVKPVARNTRLCVVRNSGDIAITEFEASSAAANDAGDSGLANIIVETLKQYDFAGHDWLLALSGGFDSRALLHGLDHVQKMKCVTWSDPNYLDGYKNDLDIAKQLASYAGREHTTKLIKRPDSSDKFESAMRRFMRYCDGRVDNFSAYIDGMQIWDEIAAGQVAGLFRGDEIFGTNVAYKTASVLNNMRLTTFGEFSPSTVQSEMVHRFSHQVPRQLLRRRGEALSRWRWRLRLEYEIPTVYSALNAVRNRFVENVCPLLSRQIICSVKGISNAGLNNKSQFRSYVRKLYPSVPIAASGMIINRQAVLQLEPVQQVMRDHLRDSFSQQIFGDRILRIIAKEFGKAGSTEWRPRRFSVSTMKDFACEGVRRIHRMLILQPGLNLDVLIMRSFLARLFLEEMASTSRLTRDSRHDIEQASA